MKTFKELLAIRDSNGNFLLGNHKEKLSSPRFRWWFWACRDWIKSGGETVQPQDLFRVNPYKRSVAEAHLELASHIREKEELSDKLGLLAQKYQLPVLMIEELVSELSGKDRRIFVRKVVLQALLVESNNKGGVTSFLELSLLSEGSGQIYAHPSMAFIEFADDFLQSTAKAVQTAKLSPDTDVRWRLVIPRNMTFPSMISGSSMGALFGLGIWLLQNEKESNYHNWLGVAATAQLCLNGQINPINSFNAKLLGAGSKSSLPAIHTVLTANSQDLGALQLNPLSNSNAQILEYRDVRGIIHLVKAEELLNAAHIIRAHLKKRWSTNNDWGFFTEENHKSVGRAWVKSYIHDFVLNSDKRFLILTAGPGFGKTTIFKDLFEKVYKQTDDETIYCVFEVFHFIKRQQGKLNNPAALLQSLIVQIRRIFALEEISLERIDDNEIPVQAFRSVLNRASERLGFNNQLVIYLDGLDEAFGSHCGSKAKLEQVIPMSLPNGIKFVITSRPGDFLDCLSAPGIAQRKSLEDFEKAQEQDIQMFLSQRIEQLINEGVMIDVELLDHLHNAAQRNFMVAVQLLQFRKGLEHDFERWKKNPDLIPVGLEEWLCNQWQTLINNANDQGVDEKQFRLTLGLLVYAEESLNLSQWEVILKEVPVKWAIDSEVFQKALNVAQAYFIPTEFSRQRYRFFHQYISDFIREKKLGDIGAQIESFFGHTCIKIISKENHSLLHYSQAHLPIHLSRSKDWENLLSILLDKLCRNSRASLSHIAVDSIVLLSNYKDRRGKVIKMCDTLMQCVFRRFRTPKAQKSNIANILLHVASEIPVPQWIVKLGCHYHSEIQTLAISHTYLLWNKDKELCLEMLSQATQDAFLIFSIPKIKRLEFLFLVSVTILSGHPEDQRSVKVLLGAGHLIVKRLLWFLRPITYILTPFISEFMRQIPDDYNPMNPVEYRYAKDEIQSDPQFQQRAIKLNKLLLDSKVDTQKYRELIEELIDHHPGNVIIISILCLLQFKVALDDFDEALDIGIMTAERACGKSVNVFQSAVYQLFFMCIGSRKPNQDQYQKIKELWGRYYEQELFDFGFKPKWTKWRRFRSLFGYEAKEPYLNIWISGFGLLIAKIENFVHLEDEAKLREIFLRYDQIAQHKGDKGKYDTAAKAFLRGLDIVGAEIGSMDKDGLRFSQATLIYILNHKVPPSDPELEMIAKTLVRFQAVRPEEAMNVIDRVKDPQLRAKLVQFKNKCKYRENMGELIGTRIAEFYRHAFLSEHWNREFFNMYQAFIEKRFFYQGIRQMTSMVLCGLRDFKSKRAPLEVDTQ